MASFKDRRYSNGFRLIKRLKPSTPNPIRRQVHTQSCWLGAILVSVSASYLFQARHDRIFHTPAGVYRIHIAGDNDIGGESSDIITEEEVARFSANMGPLNDVIKLKYTFQIVKVILYPFSQKA